MSAPVIKFDVEVVALNLATGDVTLASTDVNDVPVTMIWHYGADCTELGDKLGDTYTVSLKGPQP